MDRTRSPSAARFLRLCSDGGLPIPLVNVPLLGYEVDFLWPECRLVVEVDGSHHNSPSARAADGARDAALAAAGYPVIRVMPSEMRRGGEALLERIRSLIGDSGVG